MRLWCVLSLILSLLCGCDPKCRSVPMAEIVDVYQSRDGSHFTVLEFEDFTREIRAGKYGSVGDEFRTEKRQVSFW